MWVVSTLQDLAHKEATSSSNFDLVVNNLLAYHWKHAMKQRSNFKTLQQEKHPCSFHVALTFSFKIKPRHLKLYTKAPVTVASSSA